MTNLVLALFLGVLFIVLLGTNKKAKGTTNLSKFTKGFLVFVNATFAIVLLTFVSKLIILVL